MSVNWDWKEKMGTIEWTEYGQSYIVNVYKGNCLCVFTYNYIDNGKKVYDFCGFMHDIEHLKKCIGLAKDYEGKYDNIYKDIWVKWKLNTYYKDSLTIAKWLTKAGFTVELYYKDIKEEENEENNT